MTHEAGHMLIPLARPQYPPTPEILLSSLAWTSLQAEPKISPNSDRLVYKNFVRAGSRAALVETQPDIARFDEFGAILRSHGISVHEGSLRDAAEAAASSVLGTKPAGAKSQPASPMTRSLALMQNLRGVLNTQNPPDLGGVIETMYGLGAPANPPETSAAKLWLRAVDQRVMSDPLLFALDKAFSELTFAGPIVDKPSQHGMAYTFPQGAYDKTPFTWFHAKWNQLTSPEWVSILPARVWVDWATTTIRLAMGMGYLWESCWYEALAKQVLSLEQPTWSGVRGTMNRSLTWHSRGLKTSMRDVGRPIFRTIYKGYALRNCFEGWFEPPYSGDKTKGFTQALHDMNRNPEFRAKLIAANSAVERPAKNTHEAVTYSLTIRDTAGEFADYYGLLQRAGSYLVPNPGIEWTAVMASLSCSTPDQPTDLRKLMSDLSELGLRPEQADLIDLLEKSGLARGSADADQGLVIESAFQK